RLAPVVLEVPGAVPVVDVDQLEVVEVDGIRTGRERAAEVIRIEDLERERLPTSGRAAGEDPRPRLRNRAEVFLDVRNQLLRDGLAVRAHVRSVDRIRVVVVGRRMLERHEQHPRKLARLPLVRELRTAARALLLALGGVRLSGLGLLLESTRR